MSMSFSLASNMRRHEGPYNFVSEGSPQRLVNDMMAFLWGMPDTAYQSVLDTMASYLSQLDNLAFCHGKRLGAYVTKMTQNTLRVATGHMLSVATWALAMVVAEHVLGSCMRWLPVISFNRGHWDFNWSSPSWL